MTTLTHTQWGETFSLTPTFGHYANDRLAIQMMDDVEGPFCTVTVNMVDEPDLPEGQVYVKGWSENEEIVSRLIEARWLVPTGIKIPSGFTEASVMTLSGDLLAAYEGHKEVTP